MKEISEFEKDIASIRSMMERTAKFVSLSGMSGVLAGIYALIGAVAAYYIVHIPISPFDFGIFSIYEHGRLTMLLIVATLVLTASIVTCIFLSNRKAKKHGITLWNNASRITLINMAVPLVSGGIFILVMLYTGHFSLAAPSCLVFYGIALINGSSNTYDEIRYLGFCQIGLGLLSAAFPGYGLISWAFGFGVLHIVYGAIMHNKYDR